LETGSAQRPFHKKFYEKPIPGGDFQMLAIVRPLWKEDRGQDIAEYAVMLAVILVLVVGTIRLVGSNANNAFSSAASSIQ
jgi:Flp pilus assembly pilin Flp